MAMPPDTIPGMTIRWNTEMGHATQKLAAHACRDQRILLERLPKGGHAQKPIVANLLAKSSTSAFRSVIRLGGLSLTTFRNSDILGPLVFWISAATSTASERNSPTRAKSSSTRPRVVMACAPTRRPFGTMALLSPGMVFLFRMMEVFSQTSSDLLPFTPLERKSRRRRWLLVPPETRSNFFSERDFPKAWAFFSTCSWYSLNSGACAAFSATASAVIDWLWGPM